MPDVRRYLETIGGSEWIYTMRLLEEKPYEPIDVRVECGYPSKIELSGLKNMAVSDPDKFIAFFKEKAKHIVTSKERINRPGIKERFNAKAK